MRLLFACPVALLHAFISYHREPLSVFSGVEVSFSSMSYARTFTSPAFMLNLIFVFSGCATGIKSLSVITAFPMLIPPFQFEKPVGRIIPLAFQTKISARLTALLLSFLMAKKSMKPISPAPVFMPCLAIVRDVPAQLFLVNNPKVRKISANHPRHHPSRPHSGNTQCPLLIGRP